MEKFLDNLLGVINYGFNYTNPRFRNALEASQGIAASHRDIRVSHYDGDVMVARGNYAVAVKSGEEWIYHLESFRRVGWNSWSPWINPLGMEVDKAVTSAAGLRRALMIAMEDAKRQIEIDNDVGADRYAAAAFA